MQKDFHYYAAYCAAVLAGFTHEESLEIAYCDQFVDCCSGRLLSKINGPKSAATTQTQIELADANTDLLGLQDITRIWASFHFLPRDLYSPVKGCRAYKNKYRLICGPNGALAEETVKLAKGRGTQAIGLAMHVLSDTWAHANFAGTPSFVINNTDDYFYEILPCGDGKIEERHISLKNSPSSPDNADEGRYNGSIYQPNETSIMNLGHGRAGHLPDYSFARYRYMPAWGDYYEIVKDNPADYYRAFAQMVYALKYLRGVIPEFRTDVYDYETVGVYGEEIKRILEERTLIACEGWKALGEKLSGCIIEDFDTEKYQEEYINAGKAEKDSTFLGQFIVAAMSQKSMVTNKIFSSGNTLAGLSVDYGKGGFRGIRDFRTLVEIYRKKEAQRGESQKS